MSRRSKTTKGHGSRDSRFIRLLSAAATAGALLYWDQVLLLYLLSTLAFCGLLLVVAFSDLEGRDEELNTPASDDAADGSSGLTSTAPSRASAAVLRTEKR